MAFNTTPFHGKVARVEKNDVAMDFTSGWTIDVTIDKGEASRQGQHWKNPLPGQGQWSGTISGQIVLGKKGDEIPREGYLVERVASRLKEAKSNED